MKREQKRSRSEGNLFMFQNIAWTHFSVLYNEKVSCQMSVWLKLILGDALWMSSNVWIFNSYFKYTGRVTLQESSKNYRKEIKSSVCTGNYLDMCLLLAVLYFLEIPASPLHSRISMPRSLGRTDWTFWVKHCLLKFSLGIQSTVDDKVSFMIRDLEIVSTIPSWLYKNCE